MNGLIVTPAQVSAMNALLPVWCVVAARQALDGKWYLPASLLEDCGPGETYEVICDVLTTLEMVPWPEFPPDEL